MTDNKTNFEKLTPNRRKELIRNLNDSIELLELQALVAESRARIKKAHLEEIIYSIKISELKNPPKPDGKN